MKRGDICMVDLRPTRGHEMRNEENRPRPAMVISHEDFNKIGLAYVVPITAGGVRARNAGFAVSLMNCGLTTVGVACCDQMRSVDLVDRGAKYVETAPEFLVDQIVGMVEAIMAP